MTNFSGEKTAENIKALTNLPASATPAGEGVPLPGWGFLNVGNGEASVVDLTRKFKAAEPFPHLVLPNVLASSAAEILPYFPAPEWPQWQRYQDGYQRG